MFRAWPKTPTLPFFWLQLFGLWQKKTKQKSRMRLQGVLYVGVEARNTKIALISLATLQYNCRAWQVMSLLSLCLLRIVKIMPSSNYCINLQCSYILLHSSPHSCHKLLFRRRWDRLSSPCLKWLHNLFTCDYTEPTGTKMLITFFIW